MNVTVNRINRNQELLYVDGSIYTRFDVHYGYEFTAKTEQFQIQGTIILKESLTVEQAEERIKEMLDK